MYEITNGSHRDRLFRVRRGAPVVLRPRETRVLDLVLPPEEQLALWRQAGVIIGKPPRPVAPKLPDVPVVPAPVVESASEPQPAPVAAVHAVEIPADWRSLSWPQRRSLASKLTDEPISNGDVAERVIAAEIAKRAGA